MKYVYRLSAEEVQRIVCEHVMNDRLSVPVGTKVHAELEMFLDGSRIKYFEVTLETKS